MDPSVYRSRRPAQTPLYALLESLFETVKGVWEDLFERRYGFWRGILDGVVARYLDCGIFERGFARIRCPVAPTAAVSSARATAALPPQRSGLREQRANSRHQDLGRLHRRAAIVRPQTCPGSSGCAARVPVVKTAETR